MDDDKKKTPVLNPVFGVSNRTLLLLIILGAIALRVWGLDFALPHLNHPDEPVVVTRAQVGVVTDHWNPDAFHWPSLQIYILGFEYKIWYWVGNIFGAWSSEEYGNIPPAERFMAYGLRGPSGFYYLGRLTTALFGAGLVWLTFLLSRRFFRTRVALLCAALVAIEPIVTRNSRYVTPDIPAAFFFLAGLLYIDYLHAALNRPSEPGNMGNGKAGINPVRLAIIASVFIGLGTGTKYPVAVLGVPLSAIILFSPSILNFKARINLSLATVIITTVVFFITTPFAILDWEAFTRDVGTIGRHVQEGHIGMEAAGGIWLTSCLQFIKDSGWVWTIAGVMGLISFLLFDFKRRWHIALALVLVLAGLSPLKNVFSDRYLVPLVPFWILGIGWLVECYVGRVTDKKNWCILIIAAVLSLVGWVEGSGALLPIILVLILAVILSAVGLYAGLQLSIKGQKQFLALALILVFLAIGGRGIFVLCNEAHRLTLPYTQELAFSWVNKNIPPQSVIIEEQGGPDLFSVDPFDPHAADAIRLLPDQWYYVKEITPVFSRGGPDDDPGQSLFDTRPDWVITCERVRGRYMREGAEKDFPYPVQVFREYYGLIDDYFIEEARFIPGKGLAGDEIVIYRVPEGFWDRVIFK